MSSAPGDPSAASNSSAPDGPSAASGVARTHPRISISGQSLATVIVGPEERPFVVHEAILNHYSEFFRKAFTGGFEEAKSKTITLAEDSILTFEFFVHWLYYQHLPDSDKHDDTELVKQFNCKSGVDVPSKSHVVRLYVFGDKYDVAELRKAAIDCLFKEHMLEDSKLPSLNVIDHAFANLPEESPMCRLLVDMYFHYENLEIDRDRCTNAAFMRAIWKRYVRYHCTREKRRGFDLKLCDYHDHATEEERKVCEEHREACEKAEKAYKAARTQSQE